MKRLLLVGNPTAQSGKAASRIEEALALFRERGADVTFQETEPGGRTVETVRDRLEAGAFDACVALGGDGTFAEVGKAVLAARGSTPMGFLPSGTANNHGWSFGLRPQALVENVDVVLAGDVLPIDVGRLEALAEGGEVQASELFFDSVGWGMHPDILEARNRDRAAVERVPLLREVYRDFAVYAGATLEKLAASLVEPTAFSAVVVADGRRVVFEGVTDLIIKATPVYAGFWVLDRHSEPDDGRFELVPVQGRARWLAKALRDLRVLAWPDGVDPLRAMAGDDDLSAARFELTLDRPGAPDIAVQIDGESWDRPPGPPSGDTRDRFRVTVLPQALPLIRRRDFEPPWR